jgi:hypothetical protein
VGEAYLLRAFLQYNQSFRIALFINYLERFHLDQLQALAAISRWSGRQSLAAKGLIRPARGFANVSIQ